MNWWRRVGGWLVDYWCTVWGFLATAAFAAALASPSTEAEPSGEAGYYAAIIAMCLAAVLITEMAFARNRTGGRWWFASITGTMAMAGAYLWIADEANIHPADIDLLVSLVAVWVLTACAASFVVGFIVLAKWSPAAKKPPDE